MMTDTIFALSSGSLPAGVAVVRISGPQAAGVLSGLTRGAAGDYPDECLPPPRRAVVRSLISLSGEALDRALVLWIPGPASATGEDIAELHLHGGRAVVAAVLAAIGEFPQCRLAQPGEFTRRAFDHGRIDLIEAEGLGDLLRAETEGQRRAALAQAEGGLSQRVDQWRKSLVQLSALVEAELDFSDESDVSGFEWTDFDRTRQTIVADMQLVLDQPPAERLFDGARVLIAGRPNAGKSSLFNALIGREGAIVSDIAGTTRDLVEASIILDGWPVVLIDSAGLRLDSVDPIEQIGIGLAVDAVQSADLVIALDDSIEEWTGKRPDLPVLRVLAKADLPATELSSVAEGAKRAVLAISVKGEPGLNALRLAISDALARMNRNETDLVLRLRQREALEQALEALSHQHERRDLLLAADSLRRALNALDLMTGRGDVETVLDALFSGFCIGK